MEPIPESTEAAGELDPVAYDDVLLEELVANSERVQRFVPDLAGVSVAYLTRGLAFTVVATDAETAALDAVQYATSGPCVEVESDEALSTTQDDLFAEDRWQALARAAAARSVRSTLTLPIVDDRGRVTGSVNLYGRSAHSFESHDEEIAAIFGAWAPGAVTNADLAFSTRAEAQRAPQLVRDRNKVETAIGILAAVRRLDLSAAAAYLRDAAVRAGVSEVELAELLISSGLHDL